MKLFNEIKRRARDVIRAAKGEPWGELVRPVEFKRMEAKIETFAAERYLPPIIDEFVLPEAVMITYRRELSEDLARCLLDAGALMEEVREGPHELGLPGHYVRMTVKVVIPEGVRSDDLPGM